MTSKDRMTTMCVAILVFFGTLPWMLTSDASNTWKTVYSVLSFIVMFMVIISVSPDSPEKKADS